MTTRETTVTVAFVGLGVLGWLATNAVADGHWPWIVLVTVGVLVPSVINGVLNDREATAADDDAVSRDDSSADDR